MKLLLDENIPNGFKKDLQKKGHDVEIISGNLKGMKDNDVFKYAQKHKRCIISNDNDFRDLRPKEHKGMVKINTNYFRNPDLLISVLDTFRQDGLDNIFIDINKKGKIFKEIKKYSKKGKFKQFHRSELKLS